ncbi:ABC transporter ATP-binding protein [Vibrio sp. SCSIO 43136]|uniref:ABC transporter ATP-binding protein n=1 Tax=Vibrio sp. SCSIO 43136 TaxID=2819101 RepID=UPI0020754ACB|nr:ABC transporter ATP-binding protein [Vibrio sp. SCSIO 43136]USD68199.1 ABC transporter ATP-binding protein [Vibrio sp. SCSIO 43136]
MSANSVSIEISDGYLRYQNSNIATLEGLNLKLDSGQWTVLLGRSGCGKTTILRYLAGLLEGQVHWQGQLSTCDQLPVDDRIAYMAQQDLLLPWLSVIDNVCLGERFSASANLDARSQATQLIELVGLSEYLEATPDKLSGGMRQRVALARTLMQNKPVVLMDEPFSALDAVNRHKLQTLAHQLLKDKTVVLITHDPQEAVRLADRLYVLEGMPAKAGSISVPSSQTPRKLSEETAHLQQQILEVLERDHE